MDSKDLKIEALKQRLAEIVVEYEDKIANLRIEITYLVQQAEERTDNSTDADSE